MNKEELAGYIIMYLHVDGAHHKQHALEFVLKELVGEKEFEEYKEHYQWEEGIA